MSGLDLDAVGCFSLRLPVTSFDNDVVLGTPFLLQYFTVFSADQACATNSESCQATISLATASKYSSAITNAFEN